MTDTVYLVVVIGAALLLGAAATLAVVRAERGPSMLDRTVALDVFTTTLVAAIALEAAFSRRTDTIPLLVVLSLVGFVSSVTISRFASVEPEGEGRILTAEEVAREDAERRAAEDAERDGAVDRDHHGTSAEGEVR
ncbi:monovalent cation/H+ antiporter complex subunit F [Cellulosimicrobium marinum]|uniref:monovalent cation/H+ antiporter complex subunit F n=1 Tax=Cellulosimicrobium marinum TaxID=1638992 RepID=UPI001E36816F|nr:MrpF/PhaF family protein [Cellulosimicrobium marinum]MCB7135098.1 MrpF/PhaF family protein [Cellulosimicrobium marinum]